VILWPAEGGFKMKKLILLILILLTSQIAFAETITLTSGQVIEGEIVERTDDFIKVDSGTHPL